MKFAQDFVFSLVSKHNFMKFGQDSVFSLVSKHNFMEFDEELGCLSVQNTIPRFEMSTLWYHSCSDMSVDTFMISGHIKCYLTSYNESVEWNCSQKL
jgi:hypothetical protein